jgi:cell division protein FtsW (lipid II flippase)
VATVADVRIRSSRRAEGFLLAFAIAIPVSAYVLVGLGATGGLPANVWFFGLGTAALAIAGHGALRAWAPAADPVLFPAAFALNGVGLAMIYRLDLERAGTSSASHYATRQLAWSVIGVTLAVLVIVALRDHRKLRRFTYTAMVAGLACLLLPLLPVLGRERRGARLWIEVLGMSFQPAEIAKILLAIFFAGYLVTHRDNLALAGPKVLGVRLPRLRDLGPIVLAWVASIAVLVYEKDLGTSMLFFGLFVAMLYLATERLSWVVLGVGLFGAGAVAAGAIFPHVAARYDVWLHALDPAVYNRSTGGSEQLVRGLFGLANGGLFGTGLGEGLPGQVPFAESDFIVSSLGEELGLTGLMALLALYLLIVERAFRTAIGMRDGFGKLLAAGLGFAIALQLFVVVGGVTRLIPLTGLTTPFLAYGGSSLLANWIVIGLLLRMSHDSRREEASP